MQPYFQNNLVTIYHGDCREILPNLIVDSPVSLQIDPVWPNAIAVIKAYSNDNPISEDQIVQLLSLLMDKRSDFDSVVARLKAGRAEKEK